MALAAGSKLGPYEILSPLGAGGMGEVYRARDTRLGREVAIKVLPQHLSSNSDLKARFEREARAISALSHPHICHLYDIGSQEGTDFIVMELLEGESLADRLQKGALPLKQALEYGIEIAEALEKAHKSGIVHRDLKPGNIMLTKSGAKLLDFGLAKPVKEIVAMASASAETMSKPLTGEGKIVGTFQYMAPEQIQGANADARTDIFALGTVVYEMVTGRRAFAGKSHISVMSAILEKEPEPVSALQPLTPATLDHVIQRALAKDPAERWQSATDFKAELRWVAASSSAAHAAPPSLASRKREWVAWGFAIGGLLAALVLALILWPRPSQPGRSIRSSLLPSKGQSFRPYNFALSPDGARLAWVAVGPDGTPSLWIRALGAASAQQLTGTDYAQFPFWAPDSRRLGFFSLGKLKTIDLENSAIRILCDAPKPEGGSWNQDDVIIFVPDFPTAISRIAASGGEAVAVTKPPAGESGQIYLWPYFLPDGKHFVFEASWGTASSPLKNGLYAGALDSPDATLISTEIKSNAEFADGRLVYVQNNNLVAHPFDTARLRLAGDPVPIATQEVESEPVFVHGGFSVSGSAIVFQSTADAGSQMVWVDASGKEGGTLPAEAYRDPAISPNGRMVAVSSDDFHNGKTYISIYDLERGSRVRLTDGGIECCPHWSPDGKKIVYAAYTGDTGSLHLIAADGSGTPQLVMQGPRLLPNDWSPDGRFLLVMNFEHGPPALWTYDLEEKKNVRSFTQFGGEGQVSPDGKWLAYVSRSGLFVERFDGSGSRTAVDNGLGGGQPRWSKDGRKLYYIASDRKLMQVDFDSRSGSLSPSRTVFQTRIIAPTYILFQYDLAPDGKRFLINSLAEGGAGALTMIANWEAELKK